MSPASGPVHEPKMFPAATMEDQEKMANEENEPIVLGATPFSSPDPETDARKMLPLEDGTSAYEAKEAAASAQSTDYNSMSAAEVKSLAAERDLTVEGNKKADYVSALNADDAKDKKAADWKAEIEAAQDEEALTALHAAYEDADADYSSVEAAFDKRAEELAAEDNNES